MFCKKICIVLLLSLSLTAVLFGCGDHLTTPTEPATTTEPTEPATTTEPTEPATTTEPTEPPTTTEPTEPATTTEPTKPATTTEPTEPATTTEPTEPPTTTEPTEPVNTTEPTEPPTTTEPTEPATTVKPTEKETQPVEELPEEAAIPNNITAVASGKKTKSNDFATIDYSNTDDGYVMVRYSAATDKKLKVQVKGPATTYTYALTAQSWSAFPLSDENGDYQVLVLENVEGKKYAVVLSLTVSVNMTDEFAPFLVSNQYVNFDDAPKTVAKAASLCGGISDPLKKVEKIYDYIVGNMTYDYELAASVESGYFPKLDKVLSKMSGICFDYAALMTGMLRSQGVPAKLVVGYAEDTYHAWISVWSESTGWVDGAIYFNGTQWKRMDPTFASTGGSDMLEYIGNSSNYTAKYYY